jgi:hypothetical protein
VRDRERVQGKGIIDEQKLKEIKQLSSERCKIKGVDIMLVYFQFQVRYGRRDAEMDAASMTEKTRSAYRLTRRPACVRENLRTHVMPDLHETHRTR